MRKFVIVALFAFFAFSNASATTLASAPAVAPKDPVKASVVLTPDQARHALEVLNDPTARAKVVDTLRAIAAADALSAPAGASATAPVPASSASAVLSAITNNGLVAQLSHRAATNLRTLGASLRRSALALLDVHSVSAWWRYEISSPAACAQLRRFAGTLCAVLLPAGLIGVLVGRTLKRRIRTSAANGAAGEWRTGDGIDTVEDAGRKAGGEDATERNNEAGIDRDAECAARGERNVARARRHWSLLERLPLALVHTLLRAVPVAASVIVAVVAISALTGDDTPEDRVLNTLVQIFVVARLVTLVCGFLFAADAPKLRLLPMSDALAAYIERWLVRVVAIVAIGVALAEALVPLGLSSGAHLGILRAVTLIGHVMVAVLILQIRRPVARRLRAWSARARAFTFIGHWLADAWALIAVFLVIASWFVSALDVSHGYRVLLGHGGMSLAILIGARLAGIVIFGVLGRIFDSAGSTGGSGDDADSVALQRVTRYYPLLQRLVSMAIVIVAVTFVLWVWGVHPWQWLFGGGAGRHLLSACVTLAIAGSAAIVVWEAVNIAIERRLGNWTASGDLVRAARLRTLLPMLRTALFVAIALVIGLTGLSEIGVNIGPLLAGASIFGLALGIGSQKLVEDFITGIFLLMENAMQVGDWVTLASVSGTVEYLSIRTVRLRGSDGSLYTVPFSSVTTVNNSNRGLGNAAVRVSIDYRQDVDLAVKTLHEIGTSLREDPQFKDGIVSDFSYWGVDQVDGAMATLVGQMQCRDSARWPVQREFNRRVLEVFRERGIRIANPLRTLVVPADGFAQGTDCRDKASTSQR